MFFPTETLCQGKQRNIIYNKFCKLNSIYGLPFKMDKCCFKEDL